MALTFGAATSDRVDLGAGLPPLAAFTILCWLYPTTRTNGRKVWALRMNDGAYAIYWAFGANGIEAEVPRATVNADRASTETWTMNKWYCLAITYDDTNSVQIFRGDLTTELAEMSYTAGSITGSGAARIGGTEVSHRIGNFDVTSAWQGRIARFARWRRRLTLAELVSRQWVTRPDGDCDVFIELGYAGTGTQPNLTSLGNGKNGTVTGATVSDHAPLPLPGPTFWPPRLQLPVGAFQ